MIREKKINKCINKKRFSGFKQVIYCTFCASFYIKVVNVVLHNLITLCIFFWSALYKSRRKKYLVYHMN